MRVALILLLCAGVARAAPQVLVKGRTRIAIDSVRRTGEGVRVKGKVVESGSGAGLAEADVSLRILGQHVTAKTDDSGHFTADFTLGTGVYDLDVRFQGDGALDGSELHGYHFDIGKQAIALTVRVPPDVDSSAKAMDVILEARGDDGGVSVPITLEVGDAGATSLAAIARVPTSFEGQAKSSVAVPLLGEPGEKRLVARFTGDDAFNPAQAETAFRISVTTRIELTTLPRSPVRFESRIEVGGRLLDALGKPVPRAPMALSASGRRVADTLTDGEGKFRLRVKASELAPGAVHLSVEYVSPVAWRKGSRSAPVAVVILEPQPVPVAYTVGAFALAAAAFLGFVLARTRPWRPLVLAWRRRRRRPELAGVPEAQLKTSQSAPHSGLVPARPTIMSTLRRPGDHGFSGRVRDVVRGTPIVGAHVVLWLHQADAGVLVTDEAGRFSVDTLPDGTWRVEVAAHGFITERFEITIPHRGELRGVRVDLLPVRERVFLIYRDVALGLLPSPGLWGVWTPREILDHVRSRRPAGALGSLTDFVEETYFSPRVPDESILPDASARARAAMVER